MWGMAALLHRRTARREPVSLVREPAPSVAVPVARDAGVARRMFERFPHLTPANQSAEAFEEWCARHGYEFDTLEDMAECYLTLCEINGWPLPSLEQSAEERPSQPEPPPIAPAIIATVDDVEDEPVAEPAPRRLLSFDEAAAEFVAWIRIENRCDTYSSEQLTTLYEQHCAAADLVPVSQGHLRAALEKLDGVKRWQAKKRKSGQRHRPVRWTIRPLDASSDEIPFDLPMRRAA